MNPKKIKAIQKWPIPTLITEVRSFHGFVTFYRCFIHYFSTIIAPITDCLKKKEFKWGTAAIKAFENLKACMTEALVLRLLDFTMIFEIMYDALGIGIRGVLSQERHPIDFFNEKLNETRQRYSNYNQEFYTII